MPSKPITTSQDARRRKTERNFAIFSSLAFAAIACVIVTLLPPFTSTVANATVAAAIVIFYVLLLLVLGRRTYDPAILMTLILVLLCMLIPALRRAKERSEKAKHSAIALPSVQKGTF